MIIGCILLGSAWLRMLDILVVGIEVLKRADRLMSRSSASGKIVKAGLGFRRTRKTVEQWNRPWSLLRSFVIIGVGTAVAGSRVALAGNEGGATTRRFAEQRWALDNVIRANGIDWDQPRSLYLSSPCGVEANADLAAIRARVQKMADISPAFESTAKRREAKARAAEAEGNMVTARDNWFMAAIHYGAAEWPYDDASERHIELHNKKRECYGSYARLADHKVEAVSIPFKDKAVPAWFHLPLDMLGAKCPW